MTEWESDLRVKKDGSLLKRIRNLNVIVRSHPELDGVFRENERSGKVQLCSRGPDDLRLKWTRPRDIEDHDEHKLAEFIERRYGVEFTSGSCGESIRSHAADVSFDPVREWQTSLSWDGTQRLETLLINYAGAPDTPYVRAVTRAWVVSMVARSSEEGSGKRGRGGPGCQADYMLILKGPQGNRKTSLLKALAAPVMGATVEIGTGRLDSKDTLQLLRGPQIAIIDELSAIKKSDVESIKSFITTREDTYRPPYGRNQIVVPRRCVFAGTTNEDAPLPDDGTGNRRFWVVDTGEIDLDGLDVVRDQLIAEAVARYESLEQWWLTPEEEQWAREVQAANTPVDDRESLVAKRLDRRTEPITITEAWQEIDDQISVSKIDRRMQMEMGRMLRRCGWERRRDAHGSRSWRYHPPDECAQTDRAPPLENAA
jgi:predicted P-loop ATPase